MRLRCCGKSDPRFWRQTQLECRSRGLEAVQELFGRVARSTAQSPRFSSLDMDLWQAMQYTAPSLLMR